MLPAPSVNPPVPVPLVAFATRISRWPSPLKSASASESGPVPPVANGLPGAAVTPPFPSPNSTVTVLSPEFATATSGFPSPLKSPTTAELGAVPRKIWASAAIENSVSAAFIPNVVEALAQTGGEVDFIELQCPLDELKSRMGSASRQQFRKLTSVPLFEQLHADGVFDTSHMPSPSLTIDTSTFTPEQVAEQIAQTLQLSRIGKQAATQE